MIELLYISGLILLLYISLNIYLGISSKKWPTVPGVIESIDIIEVKNPNSSANRVFYHPHVQYTYEVNSKKYLSKSIDSRIAGSRNKQSIEDIVSHFKEGAETTIYYNPYLYSVSFLRTGLQQKLLYTFLFFIGAVLTIAGLGYFLTGQEFWLVYKVFELLNYIIG